MPARLKKLLFSIVAVLLGLFCVHAVSDAVFVAMGYVTTQYSQVDYLFCEDPDLGFCARPNLTQTVAPGETVTWKQTNNRGYREESDTELERPADVVLRIAALGDSIFFGHGIPYGCAVCELAETGITQSIHSVDPESRCEIIDTAIPCWNPSHYTILWNRDVRWFRPDGVLVSVCPNDPLNDYRFQRLEQIAQNPEFSSGNVLREMASGSVVGSRSSLRRAFQGMYLFLVRNNAFFTFLEKKKMDRLKSLRDLNIQTLSDTVDPSEIFDVYDRKLRELYTALDGTPVLCVMYPSQASFCEVTAIRGNSGPFSEDRDRAFFEVTETVSREMSVPVLNILDLYLGDAGQNPGVSLDRYFMDPIHPTEYGHALAAGAIQQWVLDHWMPPQDPERL